jgi:SM-20-related protein
MSARETLLLSLEELGWAVSDALIPSGLPESLYLESQASWQAGNFHPAQIGRGADTARQPAIRGDSICWLEAGGPGPAAQHFLDWVEQLRGDLNRRFFLGLRREEFHFARYSEGQGYRKHLDQHRGSPARKISLTLYLNPQWPPASGGELCLYGLGGSASEIGRILPELGRLVMLRSDLIPHAVLPCTQTRWSLTGWFRTDTGHAGF